MAETPDSSTQIPTDLEPAITGAVEKLYDPKKLGRVEGMFFNAITKAAPVVLQTFLKGVDGVLDFVGNVLEKIEDKCSLIFSPILARLVGHTLGADVSSEAIHERMSRAGDTAIGKLTAQTIFDIIGAPDGDLEPGDAGASRLLGALGHMTVQSWAEGVILEWATEYLGWHVDLESLPKLAQQLIDNLGLNRLTRVALRPLSRIVIATPLEWKLNKQYRPTMLGAADIVKAFLRGDYTREDAAEELARAGYSERRIDMLIAGQLKQLSLDDVLLLTREGQVDREFALATLRASGYDAPGAEMALLAADAKYLQAIHDDSVSAVRAAYVDRRIDDADFEKFLEPIYPDEPTRAAHYVAARTIRDVNTKVLSATQAAACVKAKVLPIAAYRSALAREGYDQDAILALELLLETELDTAANVETLKKQKQADADVAAKTKADAAAEKRSAAEADAARKRRGSPAELSRAAVRGLVPIERVKEVLVADYDADTVQIYLDDIAAQRVAYLAQQQKAADAEKRNAGKSLDLGQLRQAVLDDVLTLAQFSDGLHTFNYDAQAIDVLTATMRADKADHDTAIARRRQAEVAANAKGLNLSTFEQLVRRGIKTMADYDAQLAALGFADGARAGMVALLQGKINEDAAAKQLRADTTKGNAARGLSLDQARRAVILGLRSIDDFAAYVLANKYSADAQAVLIDELRDDVAQADAARTRRTAADAATEGPLLPLSTVARAARLSILTPADYEDALRARGYSDDDVAVELDLLMNEIADVQAARAKQAATDTAAPDKTLTLAQLAAAVKAGEAELTDYQARAQADGLNDADVATLVRVLGDELANTQAAKVRRAALASSTKPGDVSVAVLGQQVRDGALTLADYAARLRDAGLDPVDVDLLTALLADEGNGDA